MVAFQSLEYPGHWVAGRGLAYQFPARNLLTFFVARRSRVDPNLLRAG